MASRSDKSARRKAGIAMIIVASWPLPKHHLFNNIALSIDLSGAQQRKCERGMPRVLVAPVS